MSRREAIGAGYLRFNFKFLGGGRPGFGRKGNRHWWLSESHRHKEGENGSTAPRKKEWGVRLCFKGRLGGGGKPDGLLFAVEGTERKKLRKKEETGPQKVGGEQVLPQS